MRSSKLRVFLAASLLMVALGATTQTARAGQTATVISVANVATTSEFNVGVALPKSVADQAFTGKKNWFVDVSVTYLSVDNTIETVDSGAVPVASTQLIGAGASNTVDVQFNFSYAGHPAPGNQPSYTSTATLSKG
jgi:hypothetical protein